MGICNANRQKGSAKGLNHKEDDSALPLWDLLCKYEIGCQGGMILIQDWFKCEAISTQKIECDCITTPMPWFLFT